MITHLSNQVFFVGTPPSPAPIVLFLDSASTTILILLLLGGFSVNRWKDFTIFFVFSVYLTVKRYSAPTEFAPKSVIVYIEITTVPVQTESNLGHGLFNYQKMPWQIKIANSFHFVTVTSHIRKTKEVWQKASASRWLHSLLHNIPYNTLRLTQFLLTPPLY